MDDDRTRDAWHEAGHGLLCALEFGRVARITIAPSERANRLTDNVPESVPATSTRILEELGERKDAAKARVDTIYTSELRAERHWDGA